MGVCRNCGQHVSARFSKIFGQDGETDGCLACRREVDLFEGKAVLETDESPGVVWNDPREGDE